MKANKLDNLEELEFADGDILIEVPHHEEAADFTAISVEGCLSSSNALG